MTSIRLDRASLRSWRADPTSFIDGALCKPEGGKPHRLLPAERQFLQYAFRTGDDGRLLYPEQAFSAPKKSGKTCFARMHCLTFGSAYPEVVLAANDFDQAQGRVFEAVKRGSSSARPCWRMRRRSTRTE